MRAVIQRVSHAKVTVDHQITGEIQNGFLILLGVAPEDTEEQARYLANKCVGLRIFSDEEDRMNRSLADVGGSILAVSQFTLYGDCRKGKRPNFMGAAKGEQAERLYEYFVACCREQGIPTETGEFGADMKVELLNDGPVTILMDTDQMIRK
ncbi:MAG: D-aminoacyl-tRNA deacylase [Butyricicoccus sp.]